MAAVLWGNVYYQDRFAGVLQQDPGGRHVFTYDPAYLSDKATRPIAHTLPLRPIAFISEAGLHPFFDNLAAEGWLANAQARALRVNPANRLALLLGFGRDCAGAVSIIDPEPRNNLVLDPSDPDSFAALASRASLSGIQPKLFVVREGGRYRLTRATELSTHIAKRPSGHFNDLLELEYLTTVAIRALLPQEPTVDMELAPIEGVEGEALVIRRFDRTPSGTRVHFEEFAQLLGRRSGDDKYEGAYEDMGRFILDTPACIPAEGTRLFQRILACLLVGNTDAHFKNFAMFHTPDGLRLTPAYDLVASSNYRPYQQIALSIGGAANLSIGALRAKHIAAMAEAFGIPPRAVAGAVEELGDRIQAACDVVTDTLVGSRT
ncbi:MAG: type II toxin-antitoxin system HipA family toxin, partial [Dongiaceae bacterium]